MPILDAPSGNRVARYEDLPEAWRTCLDLAWEAHRAGSLPIAAVVTDPEGRILARGRNRLAEHDDRSPHLPGTPYLTGSPLAHAEVNALLELGYRPSGTRTLLYTTTEPCPLCMGAARMSSVEHVTFAARDPWAGCSSMAKDVPYLQRSGPTVAGPEPALEAPLVAWQVAVHLATNANSARFLEEWASHIPTACAAGRVLFENRTFDELARAGATTAETWQVLVEHLDG